MSSCVFLNTPIYSNTRQKCISFSEDGALFAVGTNDGFIIYSTDPFVPLTIREVPHGVSLISMFGRSNLLLLVSPGNPKSALLWNEDLSPPEVCAEATFHTEVTAVRLHRALIVIADGNGVHVFNQKMECSHSFQYNARSRSVGLSALAIPGTAVCNHSFASGGGTQQGTFWRQTANGGFESTNSSANSMPSLLMQQQHQDNNNNNSNNTDNASSSAMSSAVTSNYIFPIALPCPETVGSILFVSIDTRNPDRLRVIHRRSVPVHNKAIGIITFSEDGKFVASCSTGGTALKLTHVQSGNVLMQFNRGTTPNQIHSLAFAGLSYLACVSGTGSVHLFAIVEQVQTMLRKMDDDATTNDEDNNNNNTEMNDEFDEISGEEAATASGHNGQKRNAGGGGVFGFFKTMIETTTNFQEGVWSCGQFDLLQLHPSSNSKALFGPAVCSFVNGGMIDDYSYTSSSSTTGGGGGGGSGEQDRHSLKFFVAHGESGKIGKVAFFPNDSTAEKKAVQQQGAAFVQSQNAAMLQVPKGECSLMHAWIFPTDAF